MALLKAETLFQIQRVLRRKCLLFLHQFFFLARLFQWVLEMCSRAKYSYLSKHFRYIRSHHNYYHYQKCIDYIENWPFFIFIIIFLYNLYIFVWIQCLFFVLFWIPAIVLYWVCGVFIPKLTLRDRFFWCKTNFVIFTLNIPTETFWHR